MYQEPSYPTVRFLLRYGTILAAAIVAIIVAGAVIAVLFAAPVWIIAPALVVAGLVWLLIKSYVEVLAIIADTLLPK
ncbi:MAG: hypothetical protein AB7K67_10390 [Hyphomicrobiaceae bacterium]